MITWNYRVFEEPNGDYLVREVFYGEDGSIAGCTENAVEPQGQSLEALASDIECFKKALSLPILTLADIPEPQPIQQQQTCGQTISHEQLVAEIELEHSSPHPRLLT